MRTLEFIGKVQSNAAWELTVPRRDELFLKPDDWPTQLGCPMTIEITEFPKGFEKIGEDETLARLDNGKFRPALVIPQRKIIPAPIRSRCWRCCEEKSASGRQGCSRLPAVGIQIHMPGVALVRNRTRLRLVPEHFGNIREPFASLFRLQYVPRQWSMVEPAIRAGKGN